MSDKIIDLFAKQVRKACEENGEPLPEIVKNYRPGDTVLYLKGKPGPTAPLTFRDFGPLETDSQSISQLINKAYADDPDFDMVNNNTDELEIF